MESVHLSRLTQINELLRDATTAIGDVRTALLIATESELDTLAAMQSAAFVPLPPRHIALPILQDWLQTQYPSSGAGTSWAFSDNGVRAINTLPASQPWLALPRSACLTPSPTVLQVVPSGAPSLALALQLVIERRAGEQSRWKCYINALPDADSSEIDAAWRWPTSMLTSLLAGTDACDAAIRCKFATIRHYTSLLLQSEPTLASIGLGDLTWTEFSWASACTLSRQNPLGDKSRLAFIPGWDMCNHDRLRGCVTYYQHQDAESGGDDGMVCSEATSEIATGAQVTLLYGDEPAEHYLVHQGFVDSDADTVLVLRDCLSELSSPDDDVVKLRRMLLSKQLGSGPLAVRIRSDGYLDDDRLIVTARLAHATREDLAAAMRSGNGSVPINISNEHRALESIAGWLRSRLERLHDLSSITAPALAASEKTSAIDKRRIEVASCYVVAERTTLNAAVEIVAASLDADAFR